MSMFKTTLGVLDSILTRFLQSLLVIVTIVVSWQVFSRYVLNDPSSFTEELARFLLIWITLLGCVFAYRRNSHLGLDMVYSQASLSYRKWVYRFIHVCVAAFAVCVMMIGGFSLMNMTEQLGQTSPVMGIDISWVYSVVPFSGLLILLYSIEFLIQPDYNVVSHDEYAHTVMLDEDDAQAPSNTKKENK
ncbi:TRAP transporter small permease [Glaciecola sp. XM2]|uniref:TRAP transporter small permease n=1 Tax=Glaciecola sp. XM2 TaxID=1914931 RepID=UPI001BDF0F2B|nr:TRAP transporter small permease [Glaciecola sp. XM2]MBT1450769.1 TRAP transporter small permease [Glaciecola sp. XM2]